MRQISMVDSQSTTVVYTGQASELCPITHVPLSELQWPAAFRHAPHQPYECKALVRWLARTPKVLPSPARGFCYRWG